ncbi:hypothetical protein ACFL2F_04655 [Myxococcota bacterium]
MLLLAGGLCASGCGESQQTEVAFVLIRLEDLERQNLQPRDGLDRLHVVEATCEILKSDGTPVASETFDVDPQAQPGAQEVRLRGIRAGSNYFARILGLDTAGAVYECGATGPLTIKSGNKHFVEIVIVPAPGEDPGCDELCMSDDDCNPGSFCPSPLALEDSTACIDLLNCTPALCKPFSVGAACETTDDCGPDLGCISPGFGYPGGYCMKSCASDADCPQGQTWSSSCCPGSVAGLANSICSQDCLVDGDCREAEQYVCKSIDTNKFGCLPL